MLAILHLSEDILLTWARANSNTGPAFLACVLPVLTAQKTDATERALHPLVMRLLNEFGDRDDIPAKRAGGLPGLSFALSVKLFA